LPVRIRTILSVVLIALGLFLPVSSLIGYATSPIALINTDGVSRTPTIVRICPSAELYHDTWRAINEWNTAIWFFSLRFMWFELLGLKLDVTESSCDAHIILGKPYNIPLPGGGHIVDERIHAETRRITENGRVVFNVVISDLLPPGRRKDVIMHELAHVLGLLDGFSPKAPFKPASHTSALGKVTSHDVYALYVKYVKGADGALVNVPPYIPYMTADMPLSDIVSAGVSALTAFMIDRKLRGRKNK
jgi:hypothetical protein